MGHMRSGMALLWALVTLAIVAAVFAAVAPGVAQVNDYSHVEDAAATLSDLATAVDSFANYVRAPGKRAPGGLSQLTTLITGSDRSSCNNAFNTAAINSWKTNGPFGTHLSPSASGGVWTDIGLINEDVSKSAGTVGTLRSRGSDSLFLQMQNLPWPLATFLDTYVDGTIGQHAGIVQYTDSANDGTTLMSYYVSGVSGLNAC